MNKIIKTGFLIACGFLISCGGGEKKEKKSVYDNQVAEKPKVEKTTEKKEETVPPSKRVDLSTKGVGPIKSIEIADAIDQKLVTEGEAIFKQNCTACHKTDKKFIGPALAGVTKRRTPEWVMNMILNPQEMLMKDPLAKELLVEHNGSPMANQSLTEDQARALYEYFRTLM